MDSLASLNSNVHNMDEVNVHGTSNKFMIHQ